MGKKIISLENNLFNIPTDRKQSEESNFHIIFYGKKTKIDTFKVRTLLKY